MLAIVIPYYKITFFEQTLASLTNQTNKNFNVYIGNDASPDDPSGLIEIYKEKLNLTYKKFDENLGGTSLTKQWDRCIDMTRDEEWIMILGDDDTLGETVVEAWYGHKEIFSGDYNVIRFASRIITEQTGKISPVFIHPVNEKAADSCFKRFKGLTKSTLSEHVFLKQAYLKYGFYNYPLAWHSDDRAWLEFSEIKMIYTINEATVYIRNSAENISGRTDDLQIKKRASLSYHKFLLSKLALFNTEQREFLLRKFEKIHHAGNGPKLHEWVYLFGIYLKDFEPKSFKKFLKRFIKTKMFKK
ncbi:MAG: glycosyltransferase [Bacteroidota bacterium]